MSDPKMKEMRDFQWKETEGLFQGMNDLDFENMLQEELSQLPPTDEMTKAITPWRKAMTRVLLGVALTTITFQMLQLQYILPTIGLLLMLLGFRTLRKENRWFHMCWAISVLRLILSFTTLSINTMLWQEQFYALPQAGWLSHGGVILTGVQFLGLWRGICDIKRKAGLQPRTTAGALLFVWYIVIGVLGLSGYRSDILFWVLLVAHCCVLWSLYRLSLELDDCGYVVKAAPIRLDDTILTGACVLILAVGMSIGYLFFHQYPMEWSPVTEEISAEAEAVKEELIELGFPEEVLEDLTEEEILECQGALQVTAKQQEYPFNKGRTVTVKNGDETRYVTVYDVEELQLTVIAVRLPQEGRWKVFHHFCWLVNPGFYGTEAIRIWPPTANATSWKQIGEVSSRLLYDQDGQTYEAEFHSVGIYERQHPFFGAIDEYTDTVATFSLPQEGERCRGYIGFDLQMMCDREVLGTHFYYIHPKERLQYPVQTTVENYFDHLGGSDTWRSASCDFEYDVLDGLIKPKWWQ
ncbi:MAG: hypothetical protein J6I64_03130 [Lachnospiraceae bacterium]|nr:hypothetical protein [Lachnospiraceae bacterium]